MRQLITSSAFEKMLQGFLKRNSKLEQKLAKVLDTLKKDPFHPSLKTHKLHGMLSRFYACSINRDYRIVFSADDKMMILYGIGSHDEIYK